MLSQIDTNFFLSNESTMSNIKWKMKIWMLWRKYDGKNLYRSEKEYYWYFKKNYIFLFKLLKKGTFLFKILKIRYFYLPYFGGHLIKFLIRKKKKSDGLAQRKRFKGTQKVTLIVTPKKTKGFFLLSTDFLFNVIWLFLFDILNV